MESGWLAVKDRGILTPKLMEIFLRNEHPAVKPKSLCFLLPDRETPPSPARCSGLGGGRCKEPTARKHTNAVDQQIILICYQLPNHGGVFFIRTVRQGAKAARRPPTDFPVDAKQTGKSLRFPRKIPFFSEILISV